MIYIDNIHQSNPHHKCKQSRLQRMDFAGMIHIHMDLDNNGYTRMYLTAQYCFHHNIRKHQFCMVSIHSNLDFDLNMEIVLDIRHSNCLVDM